MSLMNCEGDALSTSNIIVGRLEMESSSYQCQAGPFIKKMKKRGLGVGGLK